MDCEIKPAMWPPVSVSLRRIRALYCSLLVAFLAIISPLGAAWRGVIRKCLCSRNHSDQSRMEVRDSGSDVDNNIFFPLESGDG